MGSDCICGCVLHHYDIASDMHLFADVEALVSPQSNILCTCAPLTLGLRSLTEEGCSIASIRLTFQIAWALNIVGDILSECVSCSYTAG